MALCIALHSMPMASIAMRMVFDHLPTCCSPRPIPVTEALRMRRADQQFDEPGERDGRATHSLGYHQDGIYPMPP